MIEAGYGLLLEWLRTRFDFIAPGPARIPNLIPFPWDWRLSNCPNARRLKTVVEPALERWRAQGGPCAGVWPIVICRSMGGLVARWYIEKEGGATHHPKPIALATPHRGAVVALDRLVNGVRKR